MINMLVKFNVKEEYNEAFKKALIADVRGGANESGNVEMKMFQDNNNSNIFFAYERWEDESAIEFHQQQAYTKEIMEVAKTALGGKPEVISLGETMPAPDHVSKTSNPEDDVFVIFFIFKTIDGVKNQVLDTFKNHISNTRQEEGCILFDLYTVEGDDNTFVVYEQWRKESDVWDIHMKQPYSEKTGAFLNEVVPGELNDYMSFVTEIK